MASGIVGQDAELASVATFLESIEDGAAALVLEGEAGVGKTTLWTAGLADAAERGARVLQARPAESETALSFAAIGDLLDPVLDDALEKLPGPQRRALSRALVLDDEGPAPDPHAIGVAVLNALRSLASVAPVLLGVDDAQWLDPASAAALGFSARRLRSERVGVLLATRTQSEAALVSELRRHAVSGRLMPVDVAPLDVSALHRVVQQHLHTVLPRPVLVEIYEASGGNPLYALEIVRTLERTGVSLQPGEPLPVPESLRDLVQARILALPPESRHFLLAAAASAQPTISITEAAAGESADVALQPALEARIVELVRDRIVFTHPLLAAGAYDVADPVRRSETHARLAGLLEEPEARAWQLAASVTEPSEEVAAVLEKAAHHARARGAPRTAAHLLDRANELTPSECDADADRRAVDAAYLHYESGDSPRAEAQLQGVIARLPPGRPRARALMRLGRVLAYGALSDAAQTFARAVEEAEGDPEILAVAHEGVATCLFRLHERLAESVEHSKLASAFALDLGNESLAAESLGTQWAVEALLGTEGAAAIGQRALELQPATEGGRVLAQPRFARAAGPLRELVPETGGRQAEDAARSALGQLELVLGDPAAAIDQVGGFLAFLREQGISEPCAIPFAVDQIEALIELGRREEALELLDWYERNARRLERTAALANCARCRGLLAAQAGDLDGALGAFADALDRHTQLEHPLDRGRTLLALGITQRRAKRRREARATLEHARALFDAIGAALWVARARSELERISGRAPSPDALTPAEERVAALAAEGRTNPEIADALILKTTRRRALAH